MSEQMIGSAFRAVISFSVIGGTAGAAVGGPAGAVAGATILGVGTAVLMGGLVIAGTISEAVEKRKKCGE